MNIFSKLDDAGSGDSSRPGPNHEAKQVNQNGNVQVGDNNEYLNSDLQTDAKDNEPRPSNSEFDRLGILGLLPGDHLMGLGRLR